MSANVTGAVRLLLDEGVDGAATLVVERGGITMYTVLPAKWLREETNTVALNVGPKTDLKLTTLSQQMDDILKSLVSTT